MSELSGSENLKLFNIYNHYRITVGVVLGLSAFFFSSQTTQALQGNLHRVMIITYLSVHFFSAMLIWAGLRPNARHIALSLALEIALITGLVYSGSGVSSGLGNLLIVCVAASSILLKKNVSLSLAAFASLMLLSQEGYLLIQNQSHADDMVKAGVLGIAYFVTAILITNLARRIITSESLARQRARSLEELEKLNYQIIQRMLTGILVADENGFVRMANRSALTLLGHPEDYKLAALPDAIKTRLAAWQQNPELRTDPFKQVADRAPVQANFAMLQKEKGQDVIVFMEDTGKITQQAQHLKMVSLGRLTASIAHEIRNPLGAASHAAQLLLESAELSPPDRKMAEIIHRHSLRMNNIIENVLQLSRGKVSDPHVIELIPWLDSFRQDFTAAGTLPYLLELDYDDPSLTCRFDPSHLHQVLGNLVGNGLRYSQKHSNEAWVKIQLRQVEQTEQVQLAVHDKGPGIPAKDQTHLFEPFFTTEKQGTGLGLYICKELCEANQATLEFTHGESGGGCFRITFAHPKKLT
ncbi:MAG: HAMP domain-containing histidine kinase [Hahellaceae bacterium]|nr:HAMP domain-containing histidine kinase [Hahellaceae bacterium]